jgi:hypothetical protein
MHFWTLKTNVNYLVFYIGDCKLSVEYPHMSSVSMKHKRHTHTYTGTIKSVIVLREILVISAPTERCARWLQTVLILLSQI